MQLFQDHSPRTTSGIVIVTSGIALIAVVLAVQYLTVYSQGGSDIILSSDKVEEFNGVSFPTFAIIVIAIAMLLGGASKLAHSKNKIDGYSPHYPILRRAKLLTEISLAKEKKAFWISLLSYTVIFPIVSGMAVYSQEDISKKYGVQVPSYYLIGCCGQPGNFPVLTIYFSEHFGLLLVPNNLILISILPVLVGINIAIFTYSIRSANRSFKTGVGRNISLCGISTGIISGCPTCASTIIASLAGGSSFTFAGLSMAPLSYYQPLVVLATVSLLLLAPIFSVIRK